MADGKDTSEVTAGTAQPTGAARDLSLSPSGPDPRDWQAAVAAGRRTLALEARALDALAETLDGAFGAAVACLEAVSGRVIVSGMGKSGHIGRKIAATLASTGTAAFFVHPGEASHGDLGMITQGDAVIALSNSGETAEMSDIVAYTRRFAIPLIAMTGRGGSALAQAADIALVLPAMEEACPHGLAPTTSTTMSLALGDALAVALLERKGFTASDFKLFHPGGKLGRQLMKVAELMHPAAGGLPLVPPDTPMAEALVVMTAKSFGCLGIVERTDGRLLGIVTDGDLRRHMAADLLQTAAGTVMTVSPKTIPPGMMAAEALRLMNAMAVTSFFVVDDDGRPQGLLHIHDLLRAGVA
jgi:arabinose-5-phosphate isomerase